MAVAKRYLRLPELRAVARVREIDGLDELWIESVDTLSAIELVDRLLLGGSSLDALVSDSQTATVKPGQAIDLPTAERDRLLAKIYRDNFGNKISGDMRCQHCHKPFEVEFELSELTANMDDSAVDSREEWLTQHGLTECEEGALPQQRLLLRSGQEFRLPTGRDELAIAGMDEEEAHRYLLRTCLIQAGDSVEDSTLFDAAEAIAPVMDFMLDSHCAECNHPQAVHFNMQVYLLQTLLAHKKHLMLQVHKIASRYGWELEQILSLPRSQRLAFVAMIDAE